MRKSVIYDNCKIYSPNDKFLGFVPRHRFDWYISKDLAVKISENSLKLKFEPSFKRDSVVKVEEIPKKNICIICGCDDVTQLRRFRVVPYEIKKLFSDVIKCRKSDDVVAICADDSPDADHFSFETKKKLFEKYNIDPLQFESDYNTKKIRPVVYKALKCNYDSDEAKNNTEKKLKKFFGNVPTNEELVKFMDDTKFKVVDGCRSAEEMLVKIVIEKNEVADFFNYWKKSFIDEFNPEYLPWDFYNC